MKTALIPLEPHDTPVSIRDRMAWAKSKRILLVWPRRGRPQVRPFDLTLFWRQARLQGADLALVTKDPAMRQAARALGISTFPKPQTAQDDPWQTPSRLSLPAPRRLPLRQMRQQLPVLPHLQALPGRLIVFSLGVLALFSVVWALASLFFPNLFS